MKGIKVVTASGEIVHVPRGGKVFIDGAEVCDPTPVAMPLGFERPETLESMLVRLVHQVSQGQADIGEESLDDANDFDVDEDDIFEDTYTASELHAILASPEMKEQFLREEEEKKRARAEERSGFAPGGEEIGDFVEADIATRDYERGRVGEGDRARAGGRSADVDDSGQERDREPAARSARVGKGKRGKSAG